MGWTLSRYIVQRNNTKRRVTIALPSVRANNREFAGHEQELIIPIILPRSRISVLEPEVQIPEDAYSHHAKFWGMVLSGRI